MKKIYWTEVVFLVKIFNFYQKNNFAPIDFLPARLLSVAKNSAYESSKLLYSRSYDKKLGKSLVISLI